MPQREEPPPPAAVVVTNVTLAAPVARAPTPPEDRGNISAGKDPSLVGWTHHPCETEAGRATRACRGTKPLPEKFPEHRPEPAVRAPEARAPEARARQARVPTPPPPEARRPAPRAPAISPPPIPPLARNHAPKRPAPPVRAAWEYTPIERLQWQQELAKEEFRRLKRELEEENARQGTVVLQ